MVLEQFDWEKYVKESGYGKRGGIEGVIGSFKRFFGERLFSKLDDCKRNLDKSSGLECYCLLKKTEFD